MNSGLMFRPSAPAGRYRGIGLQNFQVTITNYFILTSLKLTPRKLIRFLLITTGILLFFHLFMLFVRYGLGHKFAHGMIVMFNFDDERNIPTLFSVLLIFLSSIITWKISTLDRVKSKGLSMYWKLVSVVFFFLSMDEAFSIHEIANKPMIALKLPYGNGFFHYAWVIPYFFLVAVGGLFFFRFFLKLPVATRRKILIGATMYVGGALGFELIGGKYFSNHGFTLNYYLIITCEELLEMLGMVQFFSAFLNYFLGNKNDGKLNLQWQLQTD